jgi:N-acetylmuramoyl-L-alanine amidase
MKRFSMPSCNHDSREGQAVDMLVLHYTGMKTGNEALSRLCDANAKVSAHYVVEENGDVYALVPEERRAWHAGLSSWRGNTNINQRSIGIEIVNPGHEFGYQPFTKAQMEAVAELCRDILSRYAIPARNVVGHSDVAPRRKEDPGELFDWQWLAAQGAGLWPSGGASKPVAAEALAAYGYDMADLPKAVAAFQRHFRPALLSGIWDEECAALLARLLAQAD